MVLTLPSSCNIDATRLSGYRISRERLFRGSLSPNDVCLAGRAMKETIADIRGLLAKLEEEAETASEATAVQAVSGMELPEIIQDFVDLLMPSLTPYQAAIYMYLLRHSILAGGTQLVRVSRRGLQAGVIKSASGQSETASYQKIRQTLEALEEIGAIRQQGEANRDGTPYRVLLPEEIDICQQTRAARMTVSKAVEVKDTELDYYNVRENRLKVYERDAYKCQHCGKQLTRFTSTLDHVTAVSQGGDNSLSNLITSCRECNSKKNARLLGDFMADMNPA